VNRAAELMPKPNETAAKAKTLMAERLGEKRSVSRPWSFFSVDGAF
jgi:hypothetical protein